jgi:hypothetical protein
MRDFSNQDQKTITRWLLRVVALYSIVTVVLVAIVAVRINIIEPQLHAMRRGNPASAVLSWGNTP